MTSTNICDPCLGQDKSSVAVRYCTDCEEQLCEECFVSHSKFKALKSHHLIDLSAVGPKISITTKKYCDIHTQVLLDFYCTNHDVVCCRACIPTNHGQCHKVAPLENVSEGDDFEQNLLLKLQSIKQKHENKINEQIEKLSKFKDHLKEKKIELESVMEHGSDKQVFLVLRQIMTTIDRAETDFQTVTKSLQDFDIKFEDIPSVNLESFGSITEITRPTGIIYRPLKINEAQISRDSSKPITEFKKDGQLKLKSDVEYSLIDMVIIADSLLLTNYHKTFSKVYIYRNCKDYKSEIQFFSRPYGIAVLPGTDKAAVTLPDEKSMQFLNTATMTKGDKVNLRTECYGITATRDTIVVGGNAEIHVLDHQGSRKLTIKVGIGYIYFLHCDDSTGNIVCSDEKKFGVLN